MEPMLALGFGLSTYIPFVIYCFWVVAILISLFVPEVGLLFFIPVLPFQNIMDRLQDFPVGKDLLDISLVAVFIGWFIRAQFRKQTFMAKSPFNVPILLLVLFTYVALWKGSGYLGTAAPVSTSDPRVMRWKNYMIMFVLYFMVLNNVKDKKWATALVIVMAFSMLLMTRWFYSQYQWVKAWHFSYRQRLSLSYLGPNQLAAFFGHNMFILLGILYYDKVKLRKWLLVGVVLLSLYGVIYSFSRGIYLGVFLGLFLFGLLRDKRLLVPLLAVLVLWKTVLPVSVVERITMTTEKDEYGASTGKFDSSAAQRVDIWAKSIDLFKSSPLLGVGFEVIPFLGFDELKDTHNIYVSILAETGIVGLVLFVVLFSLAFRNSWKLFRTSNDNFFKGLGLGVFVCTFASVITNFFGDHWSYVQLGAFYWSCLALVTRGLLVEEEGKARESPEATKVKETQVAEPALVPIAKGGLSAE